MQILKPARQPYHPYSININGLLIYTVETSQKSNEMVSLEQGANLLEEQKTIIRK